MARVRNLPKNRSAIFLTRARQYEHQLTTAVERHEWEAAGPTAIHLVISSVDAVTCAKLGKVWAGEEHGGVVDLLRETGLPDLDGTIRQVASVLEMKTRIEYGAESATPSGSANLVKQATRVFAWALDVVDLDKPSSP
jgi:hypothetical protein